MCVLYSMSIEAVNLHLATTILKTYREIHGYLERIRILYKCLSQQFKKKKKKDIYETRNYSL